MLSKTRIAVAFAIMMTTPQVAAADDDTWSFKVLPYVWLSGLKGDVATLPGAPPASIDLSFGDVLENLDIAGFLVAEASYGDVFFLSELSYAAVSGGSGTSGPFFTGADLESRTFQGSLAAGYTVDRGPTHEIGVFGGFRAWVIDTELKLTGGLLGPRTISEKESFIDPIIGLRANHRFADDWSVSASGSIGGFGVGADLEWGASVGVTYHAGDSWGVVVGYRHLSVDYSDGTYLYDVDQSGPLIGAMFAF